MTGEWVEAAAEAMWRADFMRATGKMRLVEWVEAGDHAHEMWRCNARAAIAAVEPLIRAAERDECAKAGDQHADSLQQIGDTFAKVSPAFAAPYYVRAQDIRDLTNTIRARDALKAAKEAGV